MTSGPRLHLLPLPLRGSPLFANIAEPVIPLLSGFSLCPVEIQRSRGSDSAGTRAALSPSLSPVSTTPALLVAAAGVGFGHAILPDHWVPLAVVGRTRRYPLSKLARLSGLAGIAHVLVSVVLGAVIVVIGLQLRSTVEHAQNAIVGSLLIATGLAFLVLEVTGHGHAHDHERRARSGPRPRPPARPCPRTGPLAQSVAAGDHGPVRRRRVARPDDPSRVPRRHHGRRRRRDRVGDRVRRP